ncbi:two-component system, NtrC family, response regulator [Deferribacter desulfuricans SSM1]|uniref:Two-component system, NtrC family, response regulator n=1 Tax=Deferribacter desulfuricans (strain DSM 14783 / JCM 11476 / NBRC 101012 / SSM1) TaxID=639282 RepID=D3PE40_DEFDS|nr:sigma-54 dependent transcriptional regulator [Deferribacter desulfuricans]BAI80863.1 two-component system, NtrC family, response regulator [Deferribacter desulfuricans SSM1]
MKSIAIVDDEKLLVTTLKNLFEDEGYIVHTFEKGKEFLSKVDILNFDILLLDLKLPDCFGIDLLKFIKSQNKEIITIVITAHGDVSSAINAIKLGAYDFVTKPFDLDEMLLLVKRAIDEQKLKSEVTLLRERIYGHPDDVRILGESEQILKLLNEIEEVAKTDSSVLIFGESGTGKELVAQYIHKKSKRKKESFIDINCATIAENLLEVELFGYEKGAFTDAKMKKIGLIELCDGGTLFLDEIGEMPLSLQPKLLRFLENKKFRRVGGNSDIQVDVRIVAATNRNLNQLVKEGAFREDLYFRLNVFPIYVPPLRERGNDIILLAEHFLNYYSKKFGKKVYNFTNAVKQSFLEYHWPGNVRELKNLIERLVILSKKDVIDIDDLPPDIFSGKPEKRIKEKIKSDNFLDLDTKVLLFERELILDALIKAKGNKSEAAKLLGVSRYALLRKIKKYEELGL